MDEQKTWGGAGRNQGRKPIKAGDPTVPITAKITQSQKAKYLLLGGSSWLREKIDAEPDPKI
jgi:hypothetical protein